MLISNSILTGNRMSMTVAHKNAFCIDKSYNPFKSLLFAFTKGMQQVLHTSNTTFHYNLITMHSNK